MFVLGRRRFLARGCLAATGLALPLGMLWSRRARALGWDALVPDPEGILDLPEGFSYRVLEASGQAMDDGYRVPGKPDGMACFPGPEGTVVLMRNHEVDLMAASQGAYDFGHDPPEAYDPLGFGGVTRVVLDAGDFTRISSNLVLAGTARNCAGGPSPWGWLSCEETVSTGHGYVFLCSTEADRVAVPQRIGAYGRFRHEAAAVDPDSRRCYLTEDRHDGCLYRFVPDDPAAPFEGRLQAMCVVGRRNVDTAQGLQVGQTLDVEWVDVQEPTPTGDTVRVEAARYGAARVSRGEGLWWFEGALYFTSTNGGPAGRGQVFRLVDGLRRGALTLVAQSVDGTDLDFPDNITVSPWGQVFLAEDGSGDQFVRAITEDGEVVPFARNALSGGEMAGVCFSPDGQAMFVNLQHDGLTLVVTGPFPGGPQRGDEDGMGTTGDLDGTSSDTEADVSGASAGALDEGRASCACAADDPGSGAAALLGAAALGASAKTRRPAASHEPAQTARLVRPKDRCDDR